MKVVAGLSVRGMVGVWLGFGGLGLGWGLGVGEGGFVFEAAPNAHDRMRENKNKSSFHRRPRNKP